MPMVTLHKMGSGNVYHLHVLDAVDPGYGQGGGGVDPGYGHPDWSGNRPDNTLPGGRPPHISNRPPGSGGGGIPDNSLPSQPPPQVAPGYLLILARGTDGKWHYAAVAPGSAPPKPLPEPLPPDATTKPINPDEAPPPGSVAPPIAPA